MIKNTILTIAVAAAAALSAVSCKIQHDPYYSAYMTTVCNSDNVISYFVTDDSIRTVPDNWPSILLSLKQDQRISVVYTVPGGEHGDPLNAEFYSVTLLPQDSITATSEPDTLGTDRIDIAAAWHSGGIYGAGRFLTISFLIGNGGGYHTVALADDTTATANPDTDGYYHLTLCHNAHNDYPTHNINSVLTFPLEDKYTVPGIKGLKITYRPLNSTSTRTVTVPYAD